MMKDSESYREAYASQSRIFFRNPFSLNAHSRFFKGFNYFNLYYLSALSERHNSSHQCSRLDLDDNCCFQCFSLACWHYGCQPVQEGCLFGSPNSLVECCFSDH